MRPHKKFLLYLTCNRVASTLVFQRLGKIHGSREKVDRRASACNVRMQCIQAERASRFSIRHTLSLENLMTCTWISNIIPNTSQTSQTLYVDTALLLFRYTLQSFYFKFMHFLLKCTCVQSSVFKTETLFPPSLVLSRSLCSSPTP